MDYSKLSDFEINKRVLAIKSGIKPLGYAHNTDAWPIINYQWFDFCNNAADAWPIIMGNRITLMPASKGDKWMAQAFDHAIADVSTNPLRSAMIVFLMMQGDEQ
ncbi:phage protein NinX family protein [Erwinia sp. JH02]|uniref:phage protein NinX family protein n=1 Tax=Erwinia sp. JH02 TaxID=2733394 RepID=UPI00148A019D|nr:phage protein NinX family protein [Erwinia sp. JH02]NNS07310.1 DUF2591 family protein [Erwinia sp. JH02]